jgi:hypothetical protein
LLFYLKECIFKKDVFLILARQEEILAKRKKRKSNNFEETVTERRQQIEQAKKEALRKIEEILALYKKLNLTAVEKSEVALEILKKINWVRNFDITPQSSPDDSVGIDAWNFYEYNGCKRGKFPFQIVKSNTLARRHQEKHFGIPHLVIKKENTVIDAFLKYVCFFFVHNALNKNKIKKFDSGMSLLCPMKCEKGK